MAIALAGLLLALATAVPAGSSGPTPRAAPQVSFDCAPASCSVETGETIGFTSTTTSDTRIADYSWDLDGDGRFGADDEPDEPNGPDATTAERSFPSSGSFLVGLRVTNAVGESGIGRRTVTVTEPGEPAPPTPPPPPSSEDGLREVPSSIQQTRLRGNKSLGPRKLARISRRKEAPPELGSPQPIDAAYDIGQPVGCAAALCAGGVPATPIPDPDVPKLTRKPFVISDGLDPQVASSDQSLVVGMRDFIHFYDKSGGKLPAKQFKLGNTFGFKKGASTLHLCDFFEPIIPSMNAAIDPTLPHDAEDIDGNEISVENGYGINCNEKTGGTMPTNWSAPSSCPFYWPTRMFFDARVLWDEYNDRFVIVALAYNGQSRWRYVCGCTRDDPSLCVYDSADPGVSAAARSFRGVLAVAVSKSHDPRDGWDQYWTWGDPNNRTCSEGGVEGLCPYIGAIDYLTTGITKDHLLLEYTTVDGTRDGGKLDYGIPYGEKRRQITVLPNGPDAGTRSAEVSPAYQNDAPLQNLDGTQLGKNDRLVPAFQHKPDFTSGNEAFFIKKAPGGEGYVVWVMTFRFGQPQIYQEVIDALPIRAVDTDTPQRDGDPVELQVNWPGGFVYRNGALHVAVEECVAWTSSGCVQSGVRFTRIGVHGVGHQQGGQTLTSLLNDSAVDRTLHETDGSWYSFPGMEVNENGDAAFVFQRSGETTTNPEARYRVHFAGEDQPRPSGLLKAAEAARSGGWHHYVGTSVDPADGQGVWMIDGFTESDMSWGYAVGKVLGSKFPNLHVLAAKSSKKLPATSGLYKAVFKVANGGDGSARKTKATIHLTKNKGSGKKVKLKQGRLPRLRPGKEAKVKAKVPARLRGRGYRFISMTLDAGGRLEEYGEDDNTVYLRLPRGKR